MNVASQKKTRALGGFTLIELLVAMGVLALLMVLLAQVFTLVTRTWSAGRSQVDNFALARVALDMMGRDLDAAVVRPDLPAFFTDGSPTLAFYTRQQGLVSATASGSRPLSRMRYEVTATSEGSTLRRSSRGFEYGDDVGYSPAIWSVPIDAGAFDADIGPGVLIMHHQFIATDGLNRLPASVYAGWESAGVDSGVEELRAVTISLAVVDRDTLVILQESGKLAQLQANFSTADPGGLRSHAAVWQEQLDDPTAPLAENGIPERVLLGLRVFERTISLPISQQ